MLRIGFFIYEGFKATDLSAPMDSFAEANVQAKKRGLPLPYELHLFAPEQAAIAATNGLIVQVRNDLSQPPELDTLIVVGGSGAQRVSELSNVNHWLAQVQPKLRRLVSIGAGCLILSASGVLNGKTVTTHWQTAQYLQKVNTQVSIDTSRNLIQDGNVYSAAGMTASVDLALTLLEQDLGGDFAHSVAQQALIFNTCLNDMKVMGSSPTALQKGSERFLKLSDFLLNNLHKPINIDTMASSINVSPRHFRRLFKQQFAVAPMVYVEQLRINKAKALLTSTDFAISLVAQQCGYASHEVFSRRFKSHMGVSPSEFRAQF